VPTSNGSGQQAHIRVAVRVRPVPAGDHSIIEVIGQTTIAIRKEAATGGNGYLASQQGRVEERFFDRVFGPLASQEEVYAWSCQPLLKAAVMELTNATIFAYGATGAGKTHTMFGERLGSMQGLIYRAIPEVFALIQETSCTFRTQVSFMELYNEKVYDLLQESREGGGGVCNIMEDERRGLVKISNLREVEVRSAEEALDHLMAGLLLRKVESTAANLRSSRSHAVFMLQMSRAEDPLVQSKICFIDLAGSERASQTQNVGAALREGAKINQSLLALANCINALGDSTRGSESKTEGREGAKTPQRKPPYRDSKLTLLLKSSLISGGLVSMIANVHPGREHFEDSNNTLEYAKRTSILKAPVVVRREVPPSMPLGRRSQANPSPRGPDDAEAAAMLLKAGFGDGLIPTRLPQPRRSSSSGSRHRGSARASNGGHALDTLPGRYLDADATRRIARPSSGGSGGARAKLQEAALRSGAMDGMAQECFTFMPEELKERSWQDQPQGSPARSSGSSLERSQLAAPLGDKMLDVDPQRHSDERPTSRQRSLSHSSPAPAAEGDELVPRDEVELSGAACPWSPEVLLRIVDTLQAEKAALDARLRAVTTDRDRLEADCAALRAANLEKDKQLVQLLTGRDAHRW